MKGGGGVRFTYDLNLNMYLIKAVIGKEICQNLLGLPLVGFSMFFDVLVNEV